MKLTPKCACPSTDAYRCWGVRYNVWDREDVDMGGGPCECACHDEDDDDGPWFHPAGREYLATKDTNHDR